MDDGVIEGFSFGFLDGIIIKVWQNSEEMIMQTIIEKAVGLDEDSEWLRTASKILRAGGLVAFPTETVYGLGGDGLNPLASGKIYAAKGRPSDNPLIVHIADMDALYGIVRDVPEKARLLAEAFWPGPLTMIFEKNDKVPLQTTGGLESVAVRMPSHEVARALIRCSTGYIAAPSANTSGRPSPTKADHVVDDLNGRIEMIIDGGEVGIGLESTIVDFTEDIPTILRPGYITQEMLASVIGEVRMDRGLIEESSGIHPKAPGMKYKHYAPKADLVIVEGEPEAVTTYINAQAAFLREKGESCGVIAADETVCLYQAEQVLSIGSRADEESIARHLYDVLRRFDDLAVKKIYSESFCTPVMGQAIMNRLLKAAGHQVIQV